MFSCNYCGEQSDDKEELIEHLKESHIEEFFEYYFECWLDEQISIENEFER